MIYSVLVVVGHRSIEEGSHVLETNGWGLRASRMATWTGRILIAEFLL